MRTQHALARSRVRVCPRPSSAPLKLFDREDRTSYSQTSKGLRSMQIAWNKPFLDSSGHSLDYRSFTSCGYNALQSMDGRVDARLVLGGSWRSLTTKMKRHCSRYETGACCRIDSISTAPFRRCTRIFGSWKLWQEQSCAKEKGKYCLGNAIMLTLHTHGRF